MIKRKKQLIALILLAAVLGTGSLVAAQNRPNIVFIMADDMGYGDLSCFGSKVIKTPNIDSLAELGMKFTSFYVHNRCSPSRAALMTGCKADRVGLGTVVYWQDRKGINPDEITVAELLKDAGYATGIIGKWHLGEWPEFNPVHHGFDYFYGYFSDGKKGWSLFENLQKVGEVDKNDRYCFEKFLPAGISFIRKHKDEPFFLYYASHIPHAKWVPYKDFAGTSKQGAYGDCVQQLDYEVGGLLNELESLGLTKNTLVIFTSDNGAQLSADGHGSCTPLRGGKWTNFEGGVRVPCLMRWPRKIPCGTENHEITAIFDMLPTFGAIAGYKVPSDRVIDGRNILPYMLGQEVKMPIHDTFTTGSTIRHKDWKLYLKKVSPGGNGKGGMPGRTPAEEGSLFNLKEDIGETTDVSVQHPEIVQNLKKRAVADAKEFQGSMREPGYIKGFDAESAEQLKREANKNKKNKKR